MPIFGSECEIVNPSEFNAKITGNYNLEEECYLAGNTLHVRGLVGFKIKNTLKNYPEIDTVDLHSPGGGVEIAIDIAEHIRSNQITTRLQDKAQCASSCTLLYQAGYKRLAHKKALLAYHCIGVKGAAKNLLSLDCGGNPNLYQDECKERLNNVIDNTTEATFSYFSSNHVDLYDLDPSFLPWFFSKETYDSKWWQYANFCQHYYGMTAEQALKYNIVQEIN